MRDDTPPEFQAGRPFKDEVTASKLNRLANAADAARAAARSGVGGADLAHVEHWIGKVVEAGPNGEANYAAADPRYWVKRQRPDPELESADELELEDDPTPIRYGEDGYIVTATRLANNRSALTAGDFVHVFVEVWPGDPPAEHYYFLDSKGGVYPCVCEAEVGGSVGTISAAPTLLYTLKDPDTDATIVTGKTPQAQRTIGVHLAAEIGMYCVNAAGEVVLWWCDERIDREACA